MISQADRSPLDNRGSETRPLKGHTTDVSIAAQRVPPDRQPRVLPERPRGLPEQHTNVTDPGTERLTRRQSELRAPDQMLRRPSEQRSTELTRVSSDPRVSEFSGGLESTPDQSRIDR